MVKMMLAKKDANSSKPIIKTDVVIVQLSPHYCSLVASVLVRTNY